MALPSFRLPTLLMAALLPCTSMATALIVSPKDPHQYRSFQLPNRLPVLVIHDPGATHAAANVAVATGAAADPADLPGLAHLTEHLVFLGSKPFPDPNGYSGFMGRVGGNFNATTSLYSTDYYFSVPANALPEALDRLGATLSTPLFDPRYVDRERNAVDAEFHLRADWEGVRVGEALGQSLNPRHAMAAFHIGNLQTLGGDPARLRERVAAFTREHYSSLNMQLVLSGPQSLDALQAMASKSFAQLPQGSVAATSASADLVTPGLLPATLNVKPIKPTQRLLFVFPVNRNAPAAPDTAVVLSQITARGPGSLQDALRKAGLARGVGVHWMLHQHQQALLGIEIDLGLHTRADLDRVQASVFAYLDLIRQQGLEPWRLRQDAQLAAQRFAEFQPRQPLQLVREIAENSKAYPLQDWLFGPYRRSDSDVRPAATLLAALTPNNLLRVWISPEAQTDTATPWMNVPYTLARLPDWPTAQPVSELALPPANPYVADDFTLLPLAEHAPRQLIDTPGLRLWHAPEQRFEAPRASWRLSLRTPAADSAAEYVYLSLYVLWAQDRLQNTLRDARGAGLQGTVDIDDGGLMLRLDGLRQRQPLLLESMLAVLADTEVDAASFDRVVGRAREYWQPQSPSTPAAAMDSSVQLILSPGNWLPAESLKALSQVTLAEFRQWRLQWLSQLHVDAMAVGNLAAHDAEAIGQLLESRLHPRVAAAQVPFTRNRQLAAGLPLARTESTSRDSGLTLLWPLPGEGLETQADSLLLAQLIRTPFYQTLRTEQQTGYLVFTEAHPDWRRPGLRLTVQSSAYRSDEIRRRMQAFLDNVEQRIAQLDEQSLGKLRGAVVANLNARVQSANVLADRYWAEMVIGEHGYNSVQRMSSVLGERSKAQLSARWAAMRQAPALWLACDPGEPQNLASFTRTPTQLQWLPTVTEARPEASTAGRE
ncbi:hypothetical protein F3J45_16085 [Pantoea sp. Ap-967]|uniref:insulinase family protein n=1 Tax=Pantoea sp. Ap-967 TaxID=2608362 RepID=UPI001421E53A|nr:insulinase family protein [Pantoea sp. Ap-967]NIE75959.1 hypothetical protein [Pantoea sp. Ap-967]